MRPRWERKVNAERGRARSFDRARLGRDVRPGMDVCLGTVDQVAALVRQNDVASPYGAPVAPSVNGAKPFFVSVSVMSVR